MVSEEQVRESIQSVLVPVVKRSIVGLNLVREVIVSDGKVKVSLASAALNRETQDWVKTKTHETLEKLPGVNGVEASFTEAKPKDLLEKDSENLELYSVNEFSDDNDRFVGGNLTAPHRDIYVLSVAKPGYQQPVIEIDHPGVANHAIVVLLVKE